MSITLGIGTKHIVSKYLNDSSMPAKELSIPNQLLIRRYLLVFSLPTSAYPWSNTYIVLSEVCLVHLYSLPPISFNAIILSVSTALQALLPWWYPFDRVLEAFPNIQLVFIMWANNSHIVENQLGP